ncbi:MAG: hypothetical protein K0R51_735 [Cytophagaceae bacterium]|jgi:hypothetical protein|nr:hypothetical protein [Cytophagaceae bacterium]
MTISISTLNWWGLLLAFVPYCFLGALWFTLLLKKPYLKSLGKENAPEQKMAPIFIIGPAICIFVITLASAILLQALHIDTYYGAVVFALLVGLGYLVANTVNIAINPNIPRPLLYGLISGMYHLVGITICCLILVAMR